LADFSYATAEFKRQIGALSNLLAATSIWPRIEATITDDALRRELPAISAFERNTIANSSLVILASYFEEYVRQQVEEYCRSSIQYYEGFDIDFKKKFIDSYWRASVTRLERIRPKDQADWTVEASVLLEGLIRYPTRDAHTHVEPKFLCEHTNNMRLDTILELSSRVGIKNIQAGLFRSSDLKKTLSAKKSDEFNIQLKAKLNEFYNLRNEIVHAIGQSTGYGISIFDEYAIFLYEFAKAYETHLATEFQIFSTKASARMPA
jgi:hypothetical protein